MDLTWFFNCSHSEMGIHSSYETLRMIIMTGGPVANASGQDAMTDRRIEATHRHRKILHRIMRLTRDLSDAIYAAYEPRQWSPRLTLAFGKVVGLVRYAPAAREAFEDDGATDFTPWLEGVVLRNESERIERIRGEASDLHQRALHAFGRA